MSDYGLVLDTKISGRVGSNLDGLILTIRREIDNLLDNHFGQIENLIMHIVEYNGVEYYCAPDKYGKAIVVTIAEYEKGITLKDGPLKGYKVSIPKPQSDS